MDGSSTGRHPRAGSSSGPEGRLRAVPPAGPDPDVSAVPPVGPGGPRSGAGARAGRARLAAVRRGGIPGREREGSGPDLLDGMPRQRTAAGRAASPTGTGADAVPGPTTGGGPTALPSTVLRAGAVPGTAEERSTTSGPTGVPTAAVPRSAGRGATTVTPTCAQAGTVQGTTGVALAAPSASTARVLRAVRAAGRLLPTPTGTPFTFGYAVLLAVTSYVAAHADPGVVRVLHQASSTDVAHLVRYPVAVLVASGLWIVGGIASPYAVGFLLVLTALERRIGGARAAGVFLLGHVGATLATEVPVGLAVWAGHLPGSSLHRFDYGISFGVAACVGSLAGLVRPWLRWPLLALFGSALAEALLVLDDPMTNWGHLLALALGVATWPLVRRAARERAHGAAAGAGRT